MQSETTQIQENPQYIHKLSAGTLPTDESVELFADRSNGKVYFTTKGVTLAFKKLPQQYKNRLFERIMADPIAYEDLKHLTYNAALEKFAYCMYGSVDHVPDFNATGLLGSSENFICGDAHCNCQNWESKKITYQGHEIKGRLLDVLLAFRKGREDAHVCDELQIAMPTLYSHKKKLFNIFNVYSKTELVVAAIGAKIIQ